MKHLALNRYYVALLLLTATTTATAAYTYRYPVQGLKDARPQGNVAPASYSYALTNASPVIYGTVPVGQLSEKYVTLLNSGDPITISGAPLASGAASFMVTSSSVANNTKCTAGLRLQKDASCVVTASFAPTSEGAQESNLTVNITEGAAASITLQGTGAIPTRTATLSPAIGGKTTWNLDTDGPLVMDTPGMYTVTPQFDMLINIKAWGGGGGAGRLYNGYFGYLRGGGGGGASGVVQVNAGASYTLIVGSGGATTAAGTYGFGGNGYAGTEGYQGGAGGGLSGLFTGTGITATSQAAAVLIASGGGGGGTSAWGSTGPSNYGSCWGTAGGGTSVTASPSATAPTATTPGSGASYMHGANAQYSGVDNNDGSGGGGGGYWGGGRPLVYNCAGGTGGIGFAAPSVLNAVLYGGDTAVATHHQPGNANDAMRGTAGVGGATNYGTGGNGKVVVY